MAVDPLDFTRVRGRLQMLKSTGSLACWVERFELPFLTVHTRGGARPGAKLLAAIYGHEATALCIGEILTCKIAKPDDNVLQLQVGGGVEERVLEIQIRSLVRYDAPLGNARSAIEPMCALLKTFGSQAGVTVIDISSGGLGFVSHRSFKVNELVELQLRLDDVERTLRGRVRYCRKEAGLAGIYRCGISFLSQSKLAHDAWRQFTSIAA